MLFLNMPVPFHALFHVQMFFRITRILNAQEQIHCHFVRQYIHIPYYNIHFLCFQYHLLTSGISQQNWLISKNFELEINNSIPKICESIKKIFYSTIIVTEYNSSLLLPSCLLFIFSKKLIPQ